MKSIVLAGGSGHLGSLLTTAFLEKGYKVIILTRNSKKLSKEKSGAVQYVFWDGQTLGDWITYLEGAEILINLSGKSIQCRFTNANKNLLENSRILPTQILGRAVAKLQNPPRLWINFSGISIFGGLGTLQDEASTEFGTDFLAKLTQKWEAVFFQSATTNTQKVALRVSPVLSKDTGMFSEIYPLVRLGLGGQIGDGKQILAWIHEQDLVGLVFWITQQTKPSSIYHACSPYAIANIHFMQAFRDEVGISFGLPLPSFAAKIGAFFKGIDGNLILQTTPATTSLTLKQGFTFSYSTINEALHQLIYPS